MKPKRSKIRIGRRGSGSLGGARLRRGRRALTSADNPTQGAASLMSDATPGLKVRIGLLDDFVTIARQLGPLASEHTALRNHSIQFRDVLASAATRGALVYSQLELALEELRSGVKKGAISSLQMVDSRWLMSTARVVAFQGNTHADWLNAVSMYALADAIDGAPRRTVRHAMTYFQLLFAAGEYEEAAGFLKTVDADVPGVPFLVADLSNPFTGVPGGEEHTWLALLNETLRRYGLDPIGLQEESDLSPFDRIYSAPCDHVDEGLLVSVIIPTFNPDAGLHTAVESILAQSWRNLEVIIVDDGSGPEGQQAADKWKEADQRVRLVRLPTNRGTYAARNAGLDAARGELVAFQDADDWSHPRRIERQVVPLLESDTLVATRSTQVRASELLVFSRIGYPPIRPNPWSIVFKRNEVMKRIGYFDNVRKAADNEFYGRIKAAFNGGLMDLDEAPLSMQRLSTNSLSYVDFMPGWHAPARRAYRSAYEHWHRDIAQGNADAYLPKRGARPFAAPPSYLSASGARPRSYDVIFLGDWRRNSPSGRQMADQVDVLQSVGLNVGIAQAEELRRITRGMQPLSGLAQSLINSGKVDQVLPDEETSARFVMVSPGVLQYVSALPMRIRASSLIVVTDEWPLQPDGRRRYSVASCMANARALFGKEAMWVPAEPSVRAILERAVPRSLLSAVDLPPLVDVGAWPRNRSAPRGDVPVIGTYSDGAGKSFAHGLGTAQTSSVNEDGDVRILASPLQPQPQLLQDSVGRRVFVEDEVDIREFLAEIDFLVHDGVELSQRRVAEAMANGVVVVLPEQAELTFGPGPVYAPAVEVLSTVQVIHANPARYRELSAHGVTTASERFSPERYLDSFRQLAYLSGVQFEA
jgi:O-antigen biosynthesis protein